MRILLFVMYLRGHSQEVPDHFQYTIEYLHFNEKYTEYL